MPRAKKAAPKEDAVTIDHGKVKVPGTLIVTIVGSLLASVGSLAGQMKHNSDAEDMKTLQLQVVEMRNDIKWIKEDLRDRAHSEDSPELKKPESQDPSADAGTQ